MHKSSLCLIFCCFLLIVSCAAYSGTWKQVGPEGGNFVASVANPDNPLEVIVFTYPMRVLKTDDGGTSWTQLTNPWNPDTFISNERGVIGGIASATGDFRNLYVTSYTGVTCISQDQGRTWKQILWQGSIACDPEDSAHIYEISISSYNQYWESFLYESHNAGKSENLILEHPPAGDLFMSNSGTLLICSYDRIFISHDKGMTWEESSPFSPLILPLNAAAFDPTDDKRIYVAGRTLWRTEDGGKTWDECASEPLSSYDRGVLWVDPSNPSHLCSGDKGKVIISNDYGKTWTTFPRLNAGYWCNLQSPPSGKPLYLSATQSFLKSEDGGLTWSCAHRNLFCSRISSVCIDPITSFVYAEDSNSGPITERKSYGSADGAHNWFSLTDSFEYGVSYLSFNSRRPGHLFSLPYDDGFRSTNGIYRSTDSGKTFTYQPMPFKDSSLHSPIAFARDPQNPDIIYSAYSDLHMFRSTDDGITWTDDNISSPYQGCQMLAVSPSTSSTLYAVSSSYASRSDDAGKTWASIFQGAFRYPWIKYLVSRKNNIVIVGSYEGVFRSADDGETWIKNSQITTDNFACNPDGSIFISVRNYSGLICRSDDDGLSWKFVGSPGAPLQMAVDRNNEYLYAAFGGLGLWRLCIANTSANPVWEQY